jgi:hypothetical protein
MLDGRETSVNSERGKSEQGKVAGAGGNGGWHGSSRYAHNPRAVQVRSTSRYFS